ncbi:class D sortase [Anaerotruncus rubiinfantis]|uniref:class D sortase n=1 Tax=Anaerotruncus rubiinfantis TaxID=1720200 RepID=UPI0011C9914D|nr:class D sortase [Anaerotruncus rubiinfantis]
MKRILSMLLFCALLLAGCGQDKAKPDAVTPSVSPEQLQTEVDFEAAEIHTAEDGEIVVKASANLQENFAPQPEQTTAQDKPEPSAPADPTGKAFTLPEETALADGSMGVLTIPAIGVSANVYETDDEMESMTKGIAHFKITSAWAGNIGFCAHNINFDGSNGIFLNLYQLKEGDKMTYKTAEGERTYQVSMTKTIAEDDWSYLMRTDDNRLTMITCISGQPNKRLCVQATEVTE